LAPTGISSPHVTDAQVQEYYQQHLNEYAALPDSDPAARESAWRMIDTDIRLKLAPVVQAQYQEAVRKFFEQLKAQAKITVLVKIN